MPHAALWVVQPLKNPEEDEHEEVSMPHAALWVVQQRTEKGDTTTIIGFNAARGFVGGAALLLVAS